MSVSIGKTIGIVMVRGRLVPMHNACSRLGSVLLIGINEALRSEHK